MKINISQSMINQCIAERTGWNNPCPVTRTLQHTCKGKIIVNGLHILADKEYLTPAKLNQFIVDWDKKRPVGYFSFHLIPKEKTQAKEYWLDRYYPDRPKQTAFAFLGSVPWRSIKTI